MLTKVLTKIFGSRNERTLRRLRKVVQQINALEESFAALSDDELKAKTPEFRAPRERRSAGLVDPRNLCHRT